MPSLTFPIASRGPLLTVGIGVSKPMRTLMSKLKAAVPPLQLSTALLDTGASCTVIDNTVLKKLALTPRGTCKITTPSSGAAGATSFVYDVSVWILAHHPTPDVLETSIQVVGADLLHQGFEVLLGRDVLEDCTVFYNGKDKSCTLSF